MSLFIFVILPALCALTGKLVGLTVAASTFFSESGKRLGKDISRWCVPVFPIVFLVTMVIGMRGNAGFGISLFGSQPLFGMVCQVVFYSVPVLGVYVGVLYVLRDLTLGHSKQGTR